MDALVHGVVGIEPLRVLLVAIKDVRLANEALPNQVEHVHDGGSVSEGQADLRLQALRVSQRLGFPHVAIVVADRLLDQAVFPGLERLEDEVLVVAAGDDVDDVDVVTFEQFPIVRGDTRDVELGRARLREVDVEVADRNEFAQRRAMESGEMGGLAPATCANDSDP